MFNTLANLFKKPESGMVKISFVALNEDDTPYEDVAMMPYTDGVDEAVIFAKFKRFMLIRKHLVVEITILEKNPNT